MTNGNNNGKNAGQQGGTTAEQGAGGGSGGETNRSVGQAAQSVAEGAQAKLDELRSQAAPLMNRVSSQAEAAARRGMEAVRDTSQQLRERAAVATDSTVGYIKDEPIKAMLIAAATGALLMGLVSMMGRSRDD